MQFISNIASIVTVLLFLLYIIGHIWKIKQIKYTLGEVYNLENYFDEEYLPSERFVDLSDGIGQLFSVYSPNGFENVSFYEAKLDINTGVSSKGNLLKEFTEIGANDKIYAKINIPDIADGCIVEITKTDGVKISFGIAASGKNGLLEKTNYQMRLTFKSWIYYLCS